MNKPILNEIARVKQLMNIKESVGAVKFRNYTPENDFETIFSRLPEIFSKLGENWTSEAIWSNIAPVNEQLSVVAEVDGEIAGFYFINNDPIIPGGDPEVYERLNQLIGVEGVALGVFSEYKNSGIGKMLIEYPKTLGVDYIWGYQLKALDNINDWLKRRKIYLQTPGLYVTYQIFNDNEESISN
jgi:GNAT superfamily N-acetyltransferase